MIRIVIRLCLKGISSIHAIIIQECVLFDSYKNEDTIDIIELQKVLFLCMDEGV